ncbi:MAG: nitroreductase family protein [Candidatus Cloacimonetes bacterium]|nr:nitroreductase family protein [Candidatus Cloacimonadota bacterium]
MFKELVKNARSFRRFDSTHVIPDEVLEDIIDTARLTPSAANRQLIKFLLSNQKQHNDAIFPLLSWAGYLEDWQGPAQTERPTAYVVLFTEKDFVQAVNFDPGILGQTIQLAASEKGLGCCMIGAFQKKNLKTILRLDDSKEIVLVIAMGKPAETVVIDEVDSSGSIKYWRDQNSVHHVPKRKLDDIIYYVDEMV